MKNIFRIIILFTFIYPVLINPAKAQNCIGPAGQVKWSYWLNPVQSGLLDLKSLSVLENFPNRPDGSQILGTLQSPINYTDYYAGMIRGFIKVPQTDTYIFNITGDDKALFFLSTDQTATNKVKRAEVTTYTGIEERQKEAGQTSQEIQLIGGQYYYFEMYNFEGTGGDHMSLWWKKASNPSAVWALVDFNYIYEYTCGQVCPPRGTPCNDGNAATTNDQQDGFCNCVGVAPTANTCVGERGLIEAYYYDNIPGTYIENDLINAPKFPLSPDRREKLKGAYGPIPTVPLYANDSYGTLVQGYLTVPVSGTYEFNITGDNQTFFFLSKNDSIEFKQYHQAIVVTGVGEVEHDVSVLQNIPPIYLEKGKYYYFEFRHKENNWRDHFNLYWKTPFYEQKVWKRVPAFYLYDYKCEVACIAQGTPCNDDNPYTNNDKINASCDCVGTPCSGPDCNDEAVSYKVYDSCSPTDNLTTTSESSWISCGATTKPNPNTARASYKNWILYDFSNTYKFQDTRIWNYNVTGETNKGFKSVYVDYSTDGVNWQPLGGSYTWPEAPGSADYSGFSGPNFNDVKARYVLISAANNWGDATCSGFSKITFNGSLCDVEGTACDDGDPLTRDDKFDNSCNCRGENINCASDTITLSRSPLSNGEFKAIKGIAAQSSVPSTTDISFTAGNSIVLLPGFEVSTNGVFKASIANCVQQAFMANEKATAATDDKGVTDFKTDSTETNRLKKIIFRLNKPGYVKLKLKDKSENVLVTLIDSYYESLGTQIKLLPTNKLQKGLYWIELEVSGKILKEKLEIKD
ncbi:PA14 domain-containing protein [Emticicia sp. 17c]|uniref:PA14 domain-containing protein n=1 Tax=Emticicia sp. 17c TaxID=3127704 RepID=UPI00301D4CE2